MGANLEIGPQNDWEFEYFVPKMCKDIKPKAKREEVIVNQNLTFKIMKEFCKTEDFISRYIGFLATNKLIPQVDLTHGEFFGRLLELGGLPNIFS